MPTRDIRICFIGDSFVNGTGDETFLGWAGRLCASAKPADASLTFYNLGVRRNTSADILQRWKHECIPRLPDSCDGRIVLSCGVNDMVLENGKPRVALLESCSNIRKILQAAAVNYKTLLIGPAPVGNNDLNLRLQELSANYAAEAHLLGTPYIEVYSHLISDREYLHESHANDGYHPQSRGYEKIASIIHAADDWWFRS